MLQKVRVSRVCVEKGFKGEGYGLIRVLVFILHVFMLQGLGLERASRVKGGNGLKG